MFIVFGGTVLVINITTKHIRKREKKEKEKKKTEKKRKTICVFGFLKRTVKGPAHH